jgi:hypothetical protein
MTPNMDMGTTFNRTTYVASSLLQADFSNVPKYSCYDNILYYTNINP